MMPTKALLPIEVDESTNTVRKVEDQYSHTCVLSVLVSELMLQQTQVATVIRYYEAWMNVS